MNKVGIISMIITGILAISGYGAYSTSAWNSMSESANEIVIPAQSTSTVLAVEKADDKGTDMFLTVDGVSLYDDQEAVIQHLGKPLATEEDPYLGENVIYEYEHMTIGFVDGIVEYVDVSAEAGYVYINMKLIPMQAAELLDRLGNPDYTAEDGLVFVRGEAVIKLFMDPESDKLLSLSYYHMASV